MARTWAGCPRTAARAWACRAGAGPRGASAARARDAAGARPGRRLGPLTSDGRDGSAGLLPRAGPQHHQRRRRARSAASRATFPHRTRDDQPPRAALPQAFALAQRREAAPRSPDRPGGWSGAPSAICPVHGTPLRPDAAHRFERPRRPPEGDRGRGRERCSAPAARSRAPTTGAAARSRSRSTTGPRPPTSCSSSRATTRCSTPQPQPEDHGRRAALPDHPPGPGRAARAAHARADPRPAPRRARGSRVAARAAADAPPEPDEAPAEPEAPAPGRARRPARARRAREPAEPEAPAAEPEAPARDARRVALPRYSSRTRPTGARKEPDIAASSCQGPPKRADPLGTLDRPNFKVVRRSFAWQQPTSTGWSSRATSRAIPSCARCRAARPVCSLRVACNTRRKERRASGSTSPTTSTSPSGASRARTCAQYLEKGRPVAIDGRLEWREWEDKEPARSASRVDIVADSVQFLGSRERRRGQRLALHAAERRPGGHQRLPERTRRWRRRTSAKTTSRSREPTRSDGRLSAIVHVADVRRSARTRRFGWLRTVRAGSRRCSWHRRSCFSRWSTLGRARRRRGRGRRLPAQLPGAAQAGPAGHRGLAGGRRAAGGGGGARGRGADRAGRGERGAAAQDRAHDLAPGGRRRPPVRSGHRAGDRRRGEGRRAA